MRVESFIMCVVLTLFVVLSSYNVVSDPSYNSTIVLQAGNTTPLYIDGTSSTTIWQGLFGTVSGGIILDDAEGATLYDWDVVDANGEVMATRYLISDWSTVSCMNQTEIYEEEYRLGIPNSSTEGINDTYQNITHPAFEVGLKLLSGCRSTLTDNSTDDEVVFWNVLLNVNSTVTVYVGIIDNNVIGFNNTLIDYQLLVPTNRTTGYATYNLYLDLS